MLGVTEKHPKNDVVLGHRFMRGRSCLTNLISFYDKVTQQVEQGKSVDVIYFDFSTAFGAISHSILLEQMPIIQLNKKKKKEKERKKEKKKEKERKVQ